MGPHASDRCAACGHTFAMHDTEPCLTHGPTWDNCPHETWRCLYRLATV